MHIEFPAQYEADLKKVVDHLDLEAHIFSSFNSSGETVVLSAERNELEKIIQADEEELPTAEKESGREASADNFRKIRAIVRGNLS